MNASSLLLMPNISGFTSFVLETELEHSQHVISGLLETIVKANQLNLEVAEIEGDAVLFYAEGRVPSPLQVLAQTQHMFQEFRRWIDDFAAVCPCSCHACGSVRKLTLKVVAHAGPLGFTTVRQQRKPFGEAVIVLHRLLKNSIPAQEYVLLTNDLLARMATVPVGLGMVAQRSSSFYAEIGEVGFVHVTLAEISTLLAAAEEAWFEFEHTLDLLRPTLDGRFGWN